MIQGRILPRPAALFKEQERDDHNILNFQRPRIKQKLCRMFRVRWRLSGRFVPEAVGLDELGYRARLICARV